MIRIYREALWQLFSMDRVGDGLLAAIKTFYKWSMFKSGRQVSEWFSVKVDLSHRCVMSSWLFIFNLFMDGVMKEFNQIFCMQEWNLVGEEKEAGWVACLCPIRLYVKDID